ncbi:MAG: hypothetical protein IJL91_11720 [Bacteroidales bacterium]|nr:hypothetical protein [Bacteroidales bacterium]
MKKFLSLSISLIVLLGMCSNASAQSAKINEAPYKSVTLNQRNPAYWQTEWEAQVYNYKMVRNFPTLYEKEAWDAAQSAGSLMLNIHPEALSDLNKEQILAAKKAIDDLKNHQLKPFSDGINGEVIYIWGNKMPVTTPKDKLQFPLVNYNGEAIYDNADFVPYIIPYLLKNPGEAKGTIIVLSGGGNSSRSNPVEGYKIAPGFNELGYNCILLQRRVNPYNNDDIVMDLQRTVRFVKYHAKEWGIDLEGTLLAVSGYSGGGGNIRSMLQKFYGDITPDQFDSSYVCDEIDKVNSDVDVAHIIYSAGRMETENPNLPHLFIAVGADDNGFGRYGFDGAYEMFKQAYELGLDPELQVYARNGHGFGAGNAGTTSSLWMQSCDLYMQKVTGHAEMTYDGEIPAEYVLTQDFVADWFPIGATNVTAYTNAERGKVLFTFYGWGGSIMVEGVLIGGRLADVTNDGGGYFGQDAYKMWDKIDPTAWKPVQK